MTARPRPLWIFGSASLVGVVSGDSSSEVDIDSSSATGTFASSAVATGVAVTVSGVALSGNEGVELFGVAADWG